MSFIETSAEYFGSSKTTNKLSSIPIICTISPSLSTPLPQIQFAQNEIIRCLYCKSFISLFSSISQDTYSWRCSICTHENKLPFHYFSTPSSNRAELIHCNYEIFADDSYLIRPPMYPSYIFLIDISHSSSSKGFTSIVCDSISSALSNFKYNERTNVSFLLFDNDLHFVKLTGKVEIVTVPSQEPWIPLPNEEIVANFEEYEENVFNAVGEIRKIVGGNCGCIRPALDIAVEVLGVNGGKVCLFSFNWYLEGGHGKSLSLSQNTEFFDSLAEKMLKNNVACDVFVCGVAYVGLVNLLPLCTKTGGSAFYYKESDLYAADQLYWDIAKTLPQPLGWETLLKLRTSRDFRVATIFGHFTYKNDVMVIPALNNQSFTFELVPVHEITSCTFLYLQFSILYTNNEGIRLIRVFNHRVHLTNSVAGILQVINLDCLLNFYIKQAVSIMIKRDMLIAGQKYLKFRYTELKSACEENLGTWPSNLQTFEKKMQNLMHHKLFINTTLPCKPK